MGEDAEVAGLRRLLKIMRRLRDPIVGCAWDRAQSFATIAPFTIEEAYKVADAIALDDMTALVDELGDLQLQVVFHAVIAEQAGLFALPQIFTAICDKMERRHPHIFGQDASNNDGELDWEAMKAVERVRLADRSALAGIALAAPALTRAYKLQARAATLGFDWPDAAGAREKIVEELAEVDAAANAAERADELGDLLFAVVNLARKHGVDAETALRAASGKFEARFRHMEASVADLGNLDSEEQERLWRAAKISVLQPDVD